MILVVDNYDSFTYNLVQILESSEVGARDGVLVLRNDAESAAAMVARGPSGIVLSPGPGRPEGAGICVELLRQKAPVPVLGVCLGHQALAVAFGGKVGAAPKLMHGKTSRVRHGGQGLFAGLSDLFEATRYHSLTVEEDSLPESLESLAWSEDGVLMGMRHRSLPYWGVQFHPESILTKEGPLLVTNFLDVCARRAA